MNTDKNMLKDYLAKSDIDEKMLAFVANLNLVNNDYPEVAQAIVQELIDQRSHLKMIASENYSSLNVQSAMANLLTDKYAEGYVNNRYYAGCENVDTVEGLAIKEAKALFNVDHAYVQPHSGADANLVAFYAILSKKVEVPLLETFPNKKLTDLNKEEWDSIRAAMGNQRLLSLDLYSGGHITHGYRMNASAKMFDVYHYTVDKETGVLNYEQLRKQLHEVKPLIFLIGFSAYTQNIDYKLMKEYADEVGAVLMVDMAHFAGLVAGKAITGNYNPTQFADVLTTTTHKTLRGPRGGMVLCTNEFKEAVDKGCPHALGGPIANIMAAKALAFKEAQTPEYQAYTKKIIENAQAFAKALMDRDIKVLTGGTQNHIVLVDVGALGLTGRQAEAALRECGVTLNRNTIPFDPAGPWFTSGLRFGTPALTTLGMGTKEMDAIADIVANALKATKASFDESKQVTSKTKYELDQSIKEESNKKVHDILKDYILYPELDMDFIKQYI